MKLLRAFFSVYFQYFVVGIASFTFCTRSEILRFHLQFSVGHHFFAVDIELFTVEAVLAACFEVFKVSLSQ